MRRRTGALGTLIALAATLPLAGTAHAGPDVDLDCGDFRWQEDAQLVFDADRRDPHRLDEDAGPDDGIACEALPRRYDQGDTSSMSRPRPGTPTPAPVTTSPTSAAPGTPTPTPASTPTRTAPPATATATAATGSAPAVPPTTAAPSPPRGVAGGLGGASDAGPAAWEVAVGAVFVASAAAAGGYLIRRRRA
ncbi:hypothetical protein GCM10009601_50870 [Streptomyces thermospinosisporus]|uniref:Excalibur calcium-binding protein n=1 Tax=Streptomyces thermospinosisporus TaxID=161482 RepID=A0ABN1Z4J4_9ACTN